MADETTELPGVGPVKTTYVVAGLGVVGGIVLWAWWRSRSNSGGVPDMIPVVDPSQVPASDYVSPGGAAPPPNQDLTGDAITTNDEWARRATEYLQDTGWEPQLVQVALGRFLAREELSSEQVAAVQAARGLFGDPPVNGPWSIKIGMPSDVTLPAPAGLTATGATRNSITLSWTAVPGAEGYQIEQEGIAGKFHSRWDQIGNTTTTTVGDLPLPNQEYVLHVRAFKGSRQGTTATIHARTAA